MQYLHIYRQILLIYPHLLAIMGINYAFYLYQ